MHLSESIFGILSLSESIFGILSLVRINIRIDCHLSEWGRCIFQNLEVVISQNFLCCRLSE